MDGGGEEDLLKGMQRYLRRKGFRLTDLALQEERSRSAGGGLEGEQAEDLLTEVQLYLRNRGFGLTDIALLEERCRRTTTFSPFVSLSRIDDYPQAIYQGYEMLRAWANDSVDECKHELVSVLYPVFLQCSVDLVARGDTHGARRFYSAFVEDHETMHSEDLYEVKKFIYSETHWKEMVLPECLKRTKFKVKLCEYSYELLLQYLHRRNRHVMLGLINEKIKFQVSAGQPFAFPLGKETMAEMVQAGSASALVAISTLNLIAAKIETCEVGDPFAQALVSVLPYIYLPFGLAGVMLGVGAAKNKRLIDYAAGFLLLQFIYLIFVGGLRALACSKFDVSDFWAAMLYYILVVLIIWSYCCAHPKCLRSLGVCAYRCTFKKIVSACMWVYRRCSRPRATCAVKPVGNLELDLEANTEIPWARLKAQ